jgi:hypothetical protein
MRLWMRLGSREEDIAYDHQGCMGPLEFGSKENKVPISDISITKYGVMEFTTRQK